MRLDSYLHQLADGVLGRLRLQFADGGEVRHQRQVHEDGVLATHVRAELTNRFQEGERLDITDRAADLRDHHVVVRGEPADRALDLVGDVRDDLHGGTEVVAASFLRDHRLIDTPGGDVVRLGERLVDEALVVSEIQIGLGAVIGDENLSMLER